MLKSVFHEYIYSIICEKKLDSIYKNTRKVSMQDVSDIFWRYKVPKCIRKQFLKEMKEMGLVKKIDKTEIELTKKKKINQTWFD